MLKVKRLAFELNSLILAFSKKSLPLIGLTLIFIMVVAASYYKEVIFFARENQLEIPAQITFDFDLDGIESEHIYVKRSAKDEEGLRIDGSKNSLTTIYDYPGYFKARLIVDNKTLKTSDVFIKTDGWLATVPSERGYSYYHKNDISSNGLITLPKAVTERKTIDEVTFHYFDQINPMSGLDFILEADIQATTEKGTYKCDKVQIEIVGSNSSTLVPLSLSACSINAPIVIAGHEYFRADTNGKFLAANSTNEWQNFKLKVHGGIAQFVINGKEQLRLPVKSSMGQIAGLRFHFEGNGSIKNINLTDTQEVTYIESF